MPDPKKPIKVKDKNDPRYKAYQDSLLAYETLNKYKNIPRNIPFSEEDAPKIRKIWNSDLEPLERDFNPRPLIDRGKGNLKKADGYFPTKFKKPTQAVILEQQKQRQKINPLNLNLNPIGIKQSNLDLGSDETFQAPKRIPKSYKVQENINNPFGGTQTNYTIDTLDKITSPDDLGQGNTRKITEQYAMGGKLNQFNAGGSHSQNPLGGIPVGSDNQGTPNTVEQGETMKDDFVYSDRITLTKDVVGRFNLSKSLIGKTIAEATKSIDKKFIDRNDRISTSTKNGMLEKVAQAQEDIKSRQQTMSNAMQANSMEVPDMMGGQIPAGAEEFMYGGRMNKLLLGGDSVDPNANSSNMFGFTAGQTDDLINKYPTSTSIGSDTKVEGGGSGGSGISGYYGLIGAAAGAIGGGLASNSPTAHNQLLSDSEKQTNQAYEGVKSGVGAAIPIAGLFNGVEKLGKGLGQSVGGDAGGDFMQGALDPFSMLMRKDIKGEDKAKMLLLNGDPVIAGMMTHQANQKRRKALGKQTAYTMNSQFNDEGSYAMGGKINKYEDGGKRRPQIDSITESESYQNIKRNADLVNQYTLQQSMQPQIEDVNFNKVPVAGSTTDPSFGNRAANWLGNSYGDILRYAPIATNALQLSQLKKPEHQTLNRLSNRYNPSYVDEAALQNVAGQELNNTSNAIQNMGGSAGATRNALLAAGLNKSKALSDSYMNARQLNAGQDAVAQNFNLGVDQTNLSQSNLELDINDRNRANYDTQKSKLIGQMGTDIGEMGKEEVYKKMAKQMFGYKWDGSYWVKPDGTRISDDEVKKEVTLLQSNKSALGGYMIRKKR